MRKNKNLQTMSLHHRQPISGGGKSTQENTTLLPDNKHMAWHLLFQNMCPESIASEINKYYLDPRYKMETFKKRR